MRRTFLILMILLLPVRVWAGSTMGVQMALAERQAPTALQVPVHMSSDCHEHAGASDTAPENAAVAHTCLLCQMCHAVGLAAPVTTLAFEGHPGERPGLSALTFSSVDRALSFKPPIS